MGGVLGVIPIWFLVQRNDIVGVALALEDLGIDRVYSSDVSLGSGGMIPL